MGQITATRNLVAIKVVRHAGQLTSVALNYLRRYKHMLAFSIISHT